MLELAWVERVPRTALTLTISSVDPRNESRNLILTALNNTLHAHTQPLMEARPPSVVMVELHPAKMAAGGGGTATKLLQRMADWGYTDVSHSGRVCDERWLNITKSIRSDFLLDTSVQCKLRPKPGSVRFVAIPRHLTWHENRGRAIMTPAVTRTCPVSTRRLVSEGNACVTFR